jgi:hypothetical protein
MRHAQIERLWALQRRIVKAGQSHGALDAEAVLADVEELVDILLMECEADDAEEAACRGHLVSEVNPARAMDLRGVTPEQLGDPSTFRLTNDGRLVFGEGPLPFGTVFKAIEMGFRVTLQRIDGRRVTFEPVHDTEGSEP